MFLQKEMTLETITLALSLLDWMQVVASRSHREENLGIAECEIRRKMSVRRAEERAQGEGTTRISIGGKDGARRDFKIALHVKEAALRVQCGWFPYLHAARTSSQ
jgi:hypothetical protein